jgi:hypothetical protein
MKRGSLIFAVILLFIAVGLAIATMAYPLRSKLFPLIALGTASILLIVQIYREFNAGKEKEPPGEKRERASSSKQLAIWAWLVATLIMLWIFGFMGTVVLLPFLYLRSHKESWLVSIILPLGCGVFFYTLFGLALSMPLYPGIVLSRFFE